jgi:predicted MPP superfamily phosphohydrolase
MNGTNETATNSKGWQKVFSRRNFLGLGGLGAAGFGYVRFAEEEWLEINEPKLTLRPNGREIRLLHLSDFHASPVVSLSYISRAIDLGLSLKPDVICLTGDFITSKYNYFPEYSAILRKLSAAAPTLACMGNHDGGLWARRYGYSDWKLVGKLLNESGATLLHNANRVLEISATPIQFVGLGDLWANEIDATSAFKKTHPDLPTVVLSHNPDSKSELATHPWNLMLSGHTHGGQLRIPLLGTPFAPVRDKRYVAGLNPWRDRWIHTTKGVGNLHGLRLNCRPEVSLLHLTV